MTTSRASAQAARPALLLVSLAALAVCSGAPRVAAAPEASAKASTEAKGKPAPEGAIDPEATSFPYPFPVRFFRVTVVRQQARVTPMDVLPTQLPNGRTAVLLHSKNL